MELAIASFFVALMYLFNIALAVGFVYIIIRVVDSYPITSITVIGIISFMLVWFWAYSGMIGG